MYIILTRGFFRHSEPAGVGQPLLVRITDIERIEERKPEQWLGESELRFVGSALYLSSLRDGYGAPKYAGDGYGYYWIRESIAQINAQLATSRDAVTDNGVYGMARVAVQSQSHHDIAHRISIEPEMLAHE